MAGERRVIVLGCAGVALIGAAAASDFVTGSFWERHAMLTSLLAGLVVVAVTVAVVNELLERRDRRRWSLLAQSVLFALMQSARATWTALMEVLRLGEVRSGSLEPLLSAAQTARDRERVSRAVRELLGDGERRAQLQRVAGELSAHACDVIAKWAPVMVRAGPYAAVFDRHVELSGRLQWLSDVLAHREPLEGQSAREHALARASVAAERADELGGDRWLEAQVLAVIALATELDYQSREHAYELVPISWWAQRTTGLAERQPRGLDLEAPGG